MGRRRTKLVPDGAVECFEVRAVLYFDADGTELYDAEVDTPDHTGWEALPLHTVLGVIEAAKWLLIEQHAELMDE